MNRQLHHILVTGATNGLGKAFADALSNGESSVVVNVDRQKPDHDRDKFIQCDFSDRSAVDAAIDEIAKYAPYSTLIFNAGISATGKFEEIDPDGHARVLAVNAEAPMVLCSALIERGLLARGGKIAFVSSLSHFTGYPGAASYAASKDAVAVYANSIRKAFRKKHDISVTTAFPGPLKTDHAARHAPEGADESKRMTPDQAVQRILADVSKRKSKSLPGGGAKLFAVLGRVAAKPITFVMKKIIYDKLDKTVAD